MSTLIKLRRDTAANWASADPVLQLGEPGYDTTNNELRIGDGTTPWSGLTPIAGGGEAGLPLANGTSNFNIAAASGNATVGVAGTHTWTFDTTGNVTIPGDIIGLATIDIDNRATGNSADINLYAADDILIQARDRTLGSTSEGGDINIYAGDSAEDGDSSGGDIQIYAGDGGAGNTDFGGSGGFITIRSGRGGAAIGNTGATAESGGSLTLNAGDAGDNNGNIDLGSDGGDIFIESGYSTGNTNNGGDIYLTTGTGGQNGASGIVQVNIPGYGLTTGGTWTFDPNGQINIPADSSSFETGRIQSANGYPTLLGYGSGEHGGPELDWMDGNDPTDIGNSSVLRNTMYINDGGFYVGMNENEVANVASTSWRFNPNGTTIFPTLTVTRGDRTGTLTGQALLFGDAGQEALISTPNGIDGISDSQRLVINPGAGADGTTGEGGDIYLYAGRGGNVGGSGGDIKIRGGLGPVNGDGGYINIEGGEAEADGAGGYIEIFGGQSGNAAGGSLYIEGGYGRTGGDANVSGGFGAAGPGGTVSIIGGGSANGQAEYGNVIVATGSKNWTFDNTGNLVLPSGTPSINYANGDPFSGGAVNTGNVTFDDNIVIGTGDEYGFSGLYLAIGDASAANLQYFRVRGGDVPTHLHFDTGNGAYYDQYFGDDGKFVKLEAGDFGNVSIGTQDLGNSYAWTFGNDGNLTLPGNTFAVNYANGTAVSLGSNGAANTANIVFSDTVMYVAANTASQFLAISYNGESYSYLSLPSDATANATDAILRNDSGNVLVGTGTNPGGNTYSWLFGNDGKLTFPGTPRIDTADDNFEVQAAESISLEANAVVNIYTDSGNGAYQWQFGDDGNLTVPAGTTIQTAVGSNGNILIHPDGTGAVTIKGNSAGALLTVTGDEVNSFNRIEIDTFGDGSTLLGGSFGGRYARGNISNPQAVQNGDRLASFSGLGYDGTGYTSRTGGITLDVVGNWNAGSHGTHISFWTTNQGSTINQEVARIYEYGDYHQQIGNIVVSNGVVKTNAFTVSSLPLAANAGIGSRSFVTDADVRIWGNLAVGGAGNAVPVWSDGTNWYIG